MGLMNLPRRLRWVLAALLLVAAAASVDAWRLLRAQQVNDQIQALATSAPPTGTATGSPPLELRFAQAYAQAASGAHDAALNRYRALQGSTPIGQAARYNSANLLVAQARVVRESSQPGQAIALLELAKEHYRDVLRDDPYDWDARYNLERTQRLLPDADDEELAPPDQAPNRERAATTMRGYSPGLP